ncbi:unnamed protein product, partial [Aureobasidium mustum]
MKLCLALSAFAAVSPQYCFHTPLTVLPDGLKNSSFNFNGPLYSSFIIDCFIYLSYFIHCLINPFNIDSPSSHNHDSDYQALQKPTSTSWSTSFRTVRSSKPTTSTTWSTSFRTSHPSEVTKIVTKTTKRCKDTSTSHSRAKTTITTSQG